MTNPVDNITTAISPQFSLLARRKWVNGLVASDTSDPNTADVWVFCDEDLVKPVATVNEVLRRYGTQLEISEESGRIIIRLMDCENGEQIRQIPPQEALIAAQRLESLTGKLFQQEA